MPTTARNTPPVSLTSCGGIFMLKTQCSMKRQPILVHQLIEMQVFLSLVWLVNLDSLVLVVVDRRSFSSSFSHVGVSNGSITRDFIISDAFSALQNEQQRAARVVSCSPLKSGVDRDFVSIPRRPPNQPFSSYQNDKMRTYDLNKSKSDFLRKNEKNRKKQISVYITLQRALLTLPWVGQSLSVDNKKPLSTDNDSTVQESDQMWYLPS